MNYTDCGLSVTLDVFENATRYQRLLKVSYDMIRSELINMNVSELPYSDESPEVSDAHIQETAFTLIPPFCKHSPPAASPRPLHTYPRSCSQQSARLSRVVFL